MKKLYMLIVLLLAVSGMHAQVLNESANWPNPAWTLTGSYSTDPLALEADPTLTPNFAFDDDDATNGHEDNIAAESPVVNLTPAFDANEFGIEVTVMYGYRYLADDRLIFQYWDADAAVWTDWGSPVPGNNTTVTNDFCTIPKTSFTTPALNIAGFTPTQLSGFRYRISYDDNPAGSDWNYGFCFDSPTIMSIACFAPTSVMATVTGQNAEISWDGAAGTYEYVLDQSPDDPDSGTTTTDDFYNVGGLDYSTIYYFHVRSVCDGSVSGWTTIQVQTGVANDTCETAINLDELESPLNGTTAGALNDNGMHCETANIQRDVFYSITVPSGSTLIISQTVNDYDSTNVVFYGDCDNRTQIQCWDDPDVTTVTWANDTGSDQTVYWIQDGYGNTTTNAGGTFTLEWEILGCTNATATYAVVSDCGQSGGFLISVDVTSMGSADSLTISDDQGNDPQVASDPGLFTFGPYDNGTNVVISVANDQDPNCSISSGALTQMACPPANDECENAIALTPAGDYAAGAVESTIVGATASAGAPAPGCAQYLGSDVWYSVEIPDSGSITIETGPAQGITTFDSGVAVYSGSCGTLTLIECDDDDAATGNFSLISLSGRTPGEIIYIRVWEYFNDETEPFSISAWDASLGTSTFDGDSFKAYPNPVTHVLNLSYAGTIETVEVFNLMGQQVTGKTINQTDYALDMSSLPSGTYLVKMSSEGASKTVKVLKN